VLSGVIPKATSERTRILRQRVSDTATSGCAY